MSSGGMYAAGLTVSGLEMTPEEYNGTEQYARAKRAQVTLNEMWAERHGDRGITFHALHPGWADTPGVDAGLPTFAKVMGPFLRTPAQGADTLVWLAADDTALQSNGRFWLDRRTPSDPQAPDDPADRHPRTACRTLGPDRRDRPRRQRTHLASAPRPAVRPVALPDEPTSAERAWPATLFR